MTFSSVFDICHVVSVLTGVMLDVCLVLVEHNMRRGRLPATEDGTERAREEPRAGGLLLCEGFLRGTHLLTGTDARAALTPAGRVGSERE